MRLAIVNPISQTSPDRWSVPPVASNRQSITVQMGRELQGLGVDVTVYIADPYRPTKSDEGVPCVYLPIRRTPLSPPAQIPWMPSLVREVLGEGYDAVVSSEVFQWSTLGLARGLRKGPGLYVWHEADTYQRFLRQMPAKAYYRGPGRLIIDRAEGFLPRTDAALRFLRRVGVPDDKIGPEVPNGIQVGTFRPDAGLRDPDPLVLYVGSLIERKNPSLAILAMQEVCRQFPAARLVMKGFGDQEANLRTLAEERGLTGRVVFDTRRSDHAEMGRLYNAAWVAVFPSFRDFASLSPIEAVACGVPVVLSERLFHAGYLEELGCGSAASDDPGDFGAAVARLLRTYGREGLPLSSTSAVVERFSLEGGARRLLEYVSGRVRGGRVPSDGAAA